ncbi:MAG: DUF1850 domain-containing protein [Burkholderiales bacterium]|nr:DUF1850 domain-containing protein [Burkholderiales bacterium]
MCLSAGNWHAALPATAFTLRWTHSIEKIEWDEDYEIAGAWLLLSQARIRGSGAGMEPPAGARLFDGAWHYRPADRWRRRLLLARSVYAADYRICIAGGCRPLSDWIPVAAGTTTLSACAQNSQSGSSSEIGGT